MELAKTAIRAATATLLLALLPHAGSLAQEATEEQAVTSEEAADAPPPKAEAPEPAQTAAEDPFDYEATEQISEDLSVSFPVDI